MHGVTDIPISQAQHLKTKFKIKRKAGWQTVNRWKTNWNSKKSGAEDK
jgi:hypothetical protein